MSVNLQEGPGKLSGVLCDHLHDMLLSGCLRSNTFGAPGGLS